MQAVEPVIRGLGFDVVELKALQTKRNHHVTMIIYRAEGVSLDDCGEVLKTVFPRLQILLDDQDPHVEVSSPGIERVIKTVREYALFQGRGLRVLRRSDDDWRAGVLETVDAEGIRLRTAAETIKVPFGDIKKARLDYTQEV